MLRKMGKKQLEGSEKGSGPAAEGCAGEGGRRGAAAGLCGWAWQVGRARLQRGPAAQSSPVWTAGHWAKRRIAHTVRYLPQMADWR